MIVAVATSPVAGFERIALPVRGFRRIADDHAATKRMIPGFRNSQRRL